MSKNNKKKTTLNNSKPKIILSFVNKNQTKILITLLIIGTIIRVYRLGYLTLWVDEYMHALAAVNSKFTHGENNGILLTWINTSLSYIIGHSEFALRLPVALLGSLLIFSTYKISKLTINYKVGIIAASFITFSIYLIFWSRVDRPYGIVPVFMVFTMFYFLLFSNSFITINNNDTKNNKLKYGILTLVFFFLSMLSQLLCFLFVFSVGFYFTFIAIDNMITKKYHLKIYNIFSIGLILNLILTILFFTGFGLNISNKILTVFLPENIVNFILPNIKNIKEILASENWNKCYNTYLGVINTDFQYLNYLGWSGFILSFFYDRKLGYFLFSFFVIPFLLLSFIFISTSHAKYLIQIYPIFIISASFSLYYISTKLITFLNKNLNENNKTYLKFLNFLFLFLLMIIIPRKEINNIINVKQHGNIIDSKLAEISYVNWKSPCLFLKERMLKNDIVIATVRAAPQYYLGLDDVVWFRQMHLNPKWSLNSKDQEKYVPNLPDNRPISAYTYEQLVKTIENNKRGWILADYYFDNALTDPRAKQYVEQNLVFHFDACEDGAVKVFSWDKSKPKTYSSAFVIELGKNPNQMASAPLSININKAMMPPKVQFYFTAQGIDSNNEAYVFFNENGSKAVAIKTNGNSSQIGYYVAEIETSQFVNGENKIQFAYNEQEGNGDINKGFVVYNLEMR